MPRTTPASEPLPKSSLPPLSPFTAEEFKATGNKLFTSGECAKAIDAYTSAIVKDASNAVLFGNRAQCNLKLRNHSDALSDAKEVLLFPDSVTEEYSFQGFSGNQDQSKLLQGVAPPRGSVRC